jgi:hypothetical protein
MCAISPTLYTDNHYSHLTSHESSDTLFTYTCCDTFVARKPFRLWRGFLHCHIVYPTQGHIRPDVSFTEGQPSLTITAIFVDNNRHIVATNLSTRVKQHSALPYASNVDDHPSSYSPRHHNPLSGLTIMSRTIPSTHESPAPVTATGLD